MKDASPQKYIVTSATDVFIDMTSLKPPTTISLYPTMGGTMTCYVSNDIAAMKDSSSTTWEQWLKGTVSSATSDSLLASFSYLRVKASTSGTAQVVP